jgi:hypothetical protein
MIWVKALKDHYYAGPRKPGEVYQARPDLVAGLEKIGYALRYDPAAAESPEPGSPPAGKVPKRYGRRDMKPE